MLVGKVAADMSREVFALRVGGEKIAVLLRRETEIGIEFAASKEQIEGALSGRVFRATEDAGIQTPPVHGYHLLLFSIRACGRASSCSGQAPEEWKLRQSGQ
jgi:hypothetical protein